MNAETIKAAVGSRHGVRHTAAGHPAENREAIMNEK